MSSYTKPALCFLLFAAGNLGLNFFNAWALKEDKLPGFKFPIFYTMWHMIFSALASLLLMATVARPPTGLPTWHQFWAYKGMIVPIAVLTVLNNGLNNMSLSLPRFHFFLLGGPGTQEEDPWAGIHIVNSAERNPFESG